MSSPEDCLGARHSHQRQLDHGSGISAPQESSLRSKRQPARHQSQLDHGSGINAPQESISQPVSSDEEEDPEDHHAWPVHSPTWRSRRLEKILLLCNTELQNRPSKNKTMRVWGHQHRVKDRHQLGDLLHRDHTKHLRTATLLWQTTHKQPQKTTPLPTWLPNYPTPHPLHPVLQDLHTKRPKTFLGLRHHTQTSWEIITEDKLDTIQKASIGEGKQCVGYGKQGAGDGKQVALLGDKVSQNFMTALFRALKAHFLPADNILPRSFAEAKSAINPLPTPIEKEQM
ncbi:Hypp2857 [Branchiostoma lanceolatum]|uniref:Hypp2857 protein n=1 Tax=Branchiostoma lanceolatum TaxID=7740 RepID=A0A8J9ZUX6_BRALA|nr:Hypp2857 [Branchiostoma lanceolatum]